MASHRPGPPAAGRALIDIRDLTRVFPTGGGEVRALDGVSLQIRQGEFVAIMGPSGSGKSTFMNTLGCLDRPTSGTFLLDGVDVPELSRDERAAIRNGKIGFVFQSFNLLPRTSAAENVEMPLLYARGSKLGDEERRAKALRCLERVGLREKWDRGPSQLSGGEQQRVAIARSLVNDPAILLADEPTGNLDSKTSDDVMSVFQDLNDEGRTIVLITHEADIAACARRLIVFRDGRIRSDEPVRQKRLAPATPERP
jgi:putative ABC transport system ATP-binding protein